MKEFPTSLTVEDPKQLVLSDLPFSEGQEVEVLIVAKEPDDRVQMLKDLLNEKMKESGLIKEVRGPITDFTPYKDRTLMPVGSKSLSEIVIENRR